MFGVVLWSDPDEGKAVIWCEDHGDLAFLTPTNFADTKDLAEGDWIRFDLDIVNDVRCARNLAIVAKGAFSEMAQAVASFVEDEKPTVQDAMADGAQIIPFPAAKQRPRTETAAQQA